MIFDSNKDSDKYCCPRMVQERLGHMWVPSDVPADKKVLRWEHLTDVKCCQECDILLMGLAVAGRC